MIIQDCKVKIEEEEVLRLLDCRKESEIYEEFLEEVRSLKAEMEEKCAPCILIAEGEITPELAREDLPCGTPVLMVLYTIGGALSSYSTAAFQKGDCVKGLIADAMGDAALFSLGRQLSPYLKAYCEPLGKGIRRRLESPQDVGMEAQKVIFEQTKAAEVCGMRITSGYMLDPVKSCAIMYVLSDDREWFFSGHNCRKCDRLDCKGRRIPELPLKVSDGQSLFELTLKDTESILQALIREKNGSYGAVCGGNGRCGKCKIQLLEGYLPITEADEKCLSVRELEAGVRLACRAYPQEPLWIRLLFQEEMEVLSSYGGNREKESDKHPVEQSEECPDRQSDKEPEKQSDLRSDSQVPRQEKCLGKVAVDIGTTTIAMELFDHAGNSVAKDASMNHQRSFGADVISRIKASAEGSGELLTTTVRKDLTEGLKRLMAKSKGTVTAVSEMVIACNTTMAHLLLGYDCDTLGVYPFTPVSVAPHAGLLQDLLGKELPFITEETGYYLPAGISTFVGADIVSGICFAGMDQQKELSLFVDLGTNGEIALGNREKILVTSTAAGPAFEGGNLTWGVGSVEGAICGVTLENGSAQVRTIGKEPPMGICGTGVIEAVAELYQAGLVEETGLLEEAYFDHGYPLAQNQKGETICLTQKDIREIQLAKAAVRAGIEVLCLKYGVSAAEIEKVYLAGGFGFGLDVQKAEQIGMLPRGLTEKISVLGNSSLGGAAACLTDPEIRKRAEQVGTAAEEVVLSTDRDFNELYMKHMFLDGGEL